MNFEINAVRAKRPKRLPTVMTRSETLRLLGAMTGRVEAFKKVQKQFLKRCLLLLILKKTIFREIQTVYVDDQLGVSASSRLSIV